MNQTETVKLNIGGKEASPEWKIVDVLKRPEVDYVCNANDLSMFENDSPAMYLSTSVIISMKN